MDPFIEPLREFLTSYLASKAAQAFPFPKEPVQQQPQNLNAGAKPKPEPRQNENESDRLAARLKLAVKLILAGWRWDMSHSRLAEIIGLDSVAEFERILEDKSSMTNEFLDRFCEPFDMNSEWLKHGFGEPFRPLFPKVENPIYADLDKFISFIEEQSPSRIHFVKESDTEDRLHYHALMMLEFNEFKYPIISGEVYICNKNMSTTSSERLYNFYKIANQLKNRMQWDCTGWVIDSDIYMPLVRGELYPRTITQLIKSQSQWWRDFVCLDEYRDWNEQKYGAEFVKAQDLMKWYVEHDT